jgi:hypothetical protein
MNPTQVANSLSVQQHYVVNQLFQLYMAMYSTKLVDKLKVAPPLLNLSDLTKLAAHDQVSAQAAVHPAQPVTPLDFHCYTALRNHLFIQRQNLTYFGYHRIDRATSLRLVEIRSAIALELNRRLFRIEED